MTGVVVRPVDEQVRMLRCRQQAEMDLLVAWWEAKRDCEQARAGLRRLVGGRERAVSRVLGGMTRRQRLLAEHHLRAGNAVSKPDARQRLITLEYRREQLEACEQDWAARIALAEEALSASRARLAALAGPVLRQWGQARCEEMTGESWQRVAALARRHTP